MSTIAMSPKVKVVHRQIINESHQAVQELVDEYEHDLEDAIEAVRFCGGDINKAMDYLAKKDTQSGEENVAEYESMLGDEEVPNAGYDCVFNDTKLSLQPRAYRLQRRRGHVTSNLAKFKSRLKMVDFLNMCIMQSRQPMLL